MYSYVHAYAYTHRCLHLIGKDMLKTSRFLTYQIPLKSQKFPLCRDDSYFSALKILSPLPFLRWSYTSLILYHYLWECLKLCVGEEFDSKQDDQA